VDVNKLEKYLINDKGYVWYSFEMKIGDDSFWIYYPISKTRAILLRKRLDNIPVKHDKTLEHAISKILTDNKLFFYCDTTFLNRLYRAVVNLLKIESDPFLIYCIRFHTDSAKNLVIDLIPHSRDGRISITTDMYANVADVAINAEYLDFFRTVKNNNVMVCNDKNNNLIFSTDDWIYIIAPVHV